VIGIAMELSWLEDFTALVEAANFSRAAQARHLTQPAFSRRIRQLEDWVGTPLFDRTAQRPTPAGEAFRAVADEVLRRLNQGREQALEAAGAAAGALTFAATHALSLTFFPTWLRGLEARASLGAVHLVSDSLAACEEIMAQGQAQFLLCHHHDSAPSRLDTPQFRWVGVGADRLVPVGKGRALAEGAPFLGYHDESGMGRMVAALLKAKGVGLERVFTSHLATVLQAMARDGRGIGWLPLSLVAEDLAAGRLERAGGAEWDIPMDIRLIRPRSRLSPAAEAFWALLGERA
jgi:DNA-binding transcriptional LysR family regulator